MCAPLMELLEQQSGVISRRQALACGMQPHDVRRMLRRREWATVHVGVYVDHTGEPTWIQRAWAAVLVVAPAALCRETALLAAGATSKRRPEDDVVMHVAVDRCRTIVAPPGIVPHYVSGFADRVLWNASPPRVRVEHAVLDVAAGAPDQFTAISTIADAVQSRRTTAARILEVLNGRARITRRDFLAGVLNDVATGTCSLLEYGYLDRVERAHCLPSARRQVSASSRGPIHRDVDYVDFAMLVELDGRLFHDSSGARDVDLDRDLDAAIDGRSTVRLGWGQVFGRPCSTAAKVAVLLQQRGWAGTPTPCPRCRGGTVPRIGVTR